MNKDKQYRPILFHLREAPQNVEFECSDVYGKPFIHWPLFAIFSRTSYSVIGDQTAIEFRMKSIELEKMSMDNKTPSVSKKNENEKQPSPHSSAVNEKEDQLPSSSVVNEKEENPQPCSKKKKNKNVELPHSNASPRSSSSCVRHPIQLGQLQWKGLPNTYTGLHHSPFLVIRPVGLGNLNHRSGGIYIPPSSLNNIASSLNQSLNLHYQIDIDKIVCGEDTRTTLMILNIPY
ncbi:hypothetical protein L195_g032829, partial [Trifolium pratense]